MVTLLELLLNLGTGLLGLLILGVLGAAVVIGCRTAVRFLDRRVEAQRFPSERAEPMDLGAAIRGEDLRRRKGKAA